MTTGKTLVAGALSAPAAVLAEGVLNALFVAKLKSATAWLVAVGVLALSLGTLRYQLRGQPEDRRPAQAGPRPASRQKPQLPAVPPEQPRLADGEITILGNVLDPDGKVVPAAEVAVVAWSQQLPQEGQTVPRPEIWGQTQADDTGHFRLTVRRPLRARYYQARMYGLAVLAGAQGYGLGWRFLPFNTRQVTALIRLQPEQIVRGRLIDLQGQPVAGVPVEVVQVGKPAPQYRGFVTTDEDESIQTQAGVLPFGDGETIRLWEEEILFRGAPERLPLWPGPMRTDAQGRFTFRGVGRNQGIGLHVRGHEQVAFQPLAFQPRPEEQPAEVTFVPNPGCLIEGTITDAVTGRPVPGAQVHIECSDHAVGVTSGSLPADWKGRRGLVGQGYGPTSLTVYGTPAVRGRTDDQGRFRLSPFQGREFIVLVSAPEDQPYLSVRKTVPWPKGTHKQEIALALPRGTLVRGRVMEAPTGKPLANARVDFWATNFKTPTDVQGLRPDGVLYPAACKTDVVGTFQMIVPPGPGHLLINGPAPEYVYTRLAADQLSTEPLDRELLFVPPGRKREDKLHCYPDAWRALDVAAGDRPLPFAVTLRRAPLVKGSVVGPDGQPAKKVQLLQGQIPFAELVVGYFAHKYEVREGRFELPLRNLDAPLCVAFLDAANGLGAIATFTAQQVSGDPVTVHLAPCGAATARLLDAQGQPLGNYRPLLWLSLPVTPYAGPSDLERLRDYPHSNYDAVWLNQADPHHYGEGPRTDAQGRLTLPALIPGATYRVSRCDGTVKDFTVPAGKTVELGDVVIKDPGKTEKRSHSSRPPGRQKPDESPENIPRP